MGIISTILDNATAANALGVASGLYNYLEKAKQKKATHAEFEKINQELSSLLTGQQQILEELQGIVPALITALDKDFTVLSADIILAYSQQRIPDLIHNPDLNPGQITTLQDDVTQDLPKAVQSLNSFALNYLQDQLNLYTTDGSRLSLSEFFIQASALVNQLTSYYQNAFIAASCSPDIYYLQGTNGQPSATWQAIDDGLQAITDWYSTYIQGATDTLQMAHYLVQPDNTTFTLQGVTDNSESANRSLVFYDANWFYSWYALYGTKFAHLPLLALNSKQLPGESSSLKNSAVNIKVEVLSKTGSEDLEDHVSLQTYKLSDNKIGTDYQPLGLTSDQYVLAENNDNNWKLMCSNLNGSTTQPDFNGFAIKNTATGKYMHLGPDEKFSEPSQSVPFGHQTGPYLQEKGNHAIHKATCQLSSGTVDASAMWRVINGVTS